MPVIDEHAFLRMPADIRPGIAHEATAVVAESEAEPVVVTVDLAPEVSVPAPRRPVQPVGAPDRPLAGRRVLVLGGVHADAAAARTRIVEPGGFPFMTYTGSAPRPPRAQEPQVLPRGGVIDLPTPHGRPAPQWYVTAGWAPQSDCGIDVVAFLLDEDQQVTFDEDFIFYPAPESPAGTVRLLTGGPAQQTIALDLACLPPATRKVVVAAAIEAPPPSGRSAEHRPSRAGRWRRPPCHPAAARALRDDLTSAALSSGRTDV